MPLFFLAEGPAVAENPTVAARALLYVVKASPSSILIN